LIPASRVAGDDDDDDDDEIDDDDVDDDDTLAGIASGPSRDKGAAPWGR
jgi:hypothetical protein